MMYANDHDSQIPGQGNSSSESDDTWRWNFALPPYLGGAMYLHSNTEGEPSFTPRGSFVDMDRLRFYCPAYEMIPDRYGYHPNSGNQASGSSHSNLYGQITLFSGFYGQTASYQLNRALQRGMNHYHNHHSGRLHRLRSGTMLMGEYSHDDDVRGYTWMYYNPLHGGRNPILYGDGRVELREEVPPPPGFAQDRSDEQIEFYGGYLCCD